MKDSQENRVGYKLTKLGFIPEDWNISTLGELGVFLKGKGVAKSELTDKGLAAIRYGEIYTHHHFYIKKFNSFIPQENAGKSRKLVKGDLLFTCSGESREEIGKTVAYLDEDEAYAGSDIAILRHAKEDTLFLGFLLNDEIVNKQKFRLAEGHSVVHIYPQELSEILIPLPSIKEQNAIAACLSNWDRAIQTLSQLIEQKKQRKKWLMQVLLTGKMRLPCFSESWSKLKIKDIAMEVSLKNSTNGDFVVLSCTKYDGLVPSLEYFGRKIYSDNLDTYKVVPEGHYAYATNHIEEGSIGYQSEFKKGLISPMYTVFKTSEEINDDFFFPLLKSHKLIHEYQRRMEGSINRRGGLRWEGFSSIPISIPTIEEQTAIAKVLQTADKEIEILTRKLNFLKDQKKGLMQQLLTGRKRLPLYKN